MWRELERLAEYAAEQRRREFGVNFVCLDGKITTKYSIPLRKVHETMAYHYVFDKKRTACITAEENDGNRWPTWRIVVHSARVLTSSQVPGVQTH